MQKFVFVLLWLAAGVSAYAECPDVRLDVGGVMSAMPVFDQATAGGEKDMNLCYAVAATQLLDASRLSQAKPTELTSPWWVAVNYSVQYKGRGAKADLEFGETDKALESAKQFGLCRQSDLFDDHKTEDIIQFHTDLKRVYSGDDRESKLETLLQNFRYLKDPKKLAEVSIKVLKEKTFLSFLKVLFSEKCEGKVYQEPQFEVDRQDLDLNPITLEQKQDLIRHTLTSKQPLEASICSQALRNPAYRGILQSGKFARDCMRHSVLVLGSREQAGQCQYLVRDTYGANSCQRQLHGNAWYHSSFECQGGQVWVPEKVLFDNTWGVTRVIRKPSADQAKL